MSSVRDPIGWIAEKFNRGSYVRALPLTTTNLSLSANTINYSIFQTSCSALIYPTLMEAAASIVGLLAAGVKIYGALHQLISSSVGAPLLARTLCDEVRDFRFALERLQPHVNGSSPITQPGSSRTDVEHLSWTLAGCVVTFSLLEKKLDRVIAQHGRMTTLARLRWVFAESDILQLVNRLQQHKATLTLLLTIFIRHVAFRDPLNSIPKIL